jgi:hypothetical protein
MEQFIPNIKDADIQRIVERESPQSKFVDIETILKVYVSETEQGKNRVYASVLKLSEGNIDLLKKYTDKANTDYRDVISSAEYPNYSDSGFEDLSENEEEQIIKDDWAQYQHWLNKG